MLYAGTSVPERALSLRRTAPLVLALVLVACGRSGRDEEPAQAEQPQMESPATAPADLEAQLGQETYDELRDNGEIIASSSLYDALNPIASRIGRAAQPQYDRPFRFILVHEPEPNAFSCLMPAVRPRPSPLE